ncbi:hypothetical protein PPTG_24438 [Phytophthora nicotianae INRA-310]|uniref:Uncharacterized protein n=1 Tax=Phytophthora nicotianae (strain INRA-310) TaxID=761204 RepID=W2PE82_PHYN3|nr:hypothetical protein PPTG_24438 [Phytophthora nicotianae INRA-310]ETM99362.1 hypothetical protein PPTG_24438 [Phytophthora nicotianae INRA-310]
MRLERQDRDLSRDRPRVNLRKAYCHKLADNHP